MKIFLKKRLLKDLNLLDKCIIPGADDTKQFEQGYCNGFVKGFYYALSLSKTAVLLLILTAIIITTII